MLKITKYNIINCAKCTKKNMLEKETKLLFELITNKTPINKAIKIVAKDVFDNPVMVTNSYFHVIDMSTDKDFADSVWDYAKKHHCCSKESILAFKEDEASSVLFSSDEAFLYDTNLGKDIPRILCRIAQSGITYGYLIIFEVNHKLTNKDIEKTNLVAKSLAVIMSNANNLDSLTNSRKEYFFKQLLKVSLNNRLELENEISQFQWSFKQYFIVFSIKCPQYESHYVYLEKQLNQISDDITAFIYENQILVLCNYNKIDTLDEHIVSIDSTFKEYKPIIGISKEFDKLINLKTYVNQATNARELGSLIDPNLNKYDYINYEYYDLLKHYNKEELHPLIASEYTKLKMYDKENDTDLLNTYITYYLCSLNSTRTSEVLHVHRNTLMYRLKQIEDILRININDIKVLDNIYHSQMIDKYLGI